MRPRASRGDESGSKMDRGHSRYANRYHRGDRLRMVRFGRPTGIGNGCLVVVADVVTISINDGRCRRGRRVSFRR